MFWRTLCVLLLLGNGLFYAWSQGYFGRLDDGREPQRLAHQLDADKLRIHPLPPESAPAAAPAALACQHSEPLELSAAEALLARLQSAVPTSDGETPATRGDAADPVQASLQTIALAPRLWVHIPAQGNRPQMEKKLRELKQLGITEVDPRLEAGNDQFAIGLGLFEHAERAQVHLQELNRRGVRSAIISERERLPQQARVILRGAAADVTARLATLTTAAPDATQEAPVPFSDCSANP